jgi:hypothetical protein
MQPAAAALRELQSKGLTVVALPAADIGTLAKCAAEAKALTRAQFVQSSPGRWHCAERGLMPPASVAAFAALESSWLPLITEFFASADGGPDLDPRPWYRSELQLLCADAGAVQQFFHQDNR